MINNPKNLFKNKKLVHATACFLTAAASMFAVELKTFNHFSAPNSQNQISNKVSTGLYNWKTFQYFDYDQNNHFQPHSTTLNAWSYDGGKNKLHWGVQTMNLLFNPYGFEVNYFSNGDGSQTNLKNFLHVSIPFVKGLDNLILSADNFDQYWTYDATKHYVRFIYQLNTNGYSLLDIRMQFGHAYGQWAPDVLTMTLFNPAYDVVAKFIIDSDSVPLYQDPWILYFDKMQVLPFSTNTSTLPVGIYEIISGTCFDIAAIKTSNPVPEDLDYLTKWVYKPLKPALKTTTLLTVDITFEITDEHAKLSLDNWTLSFPSQ